MNGGRGASPGRVPPWVPLVGRATSGTRPRTRVAGADALTSLRLVIARDGDDDVRHRVPSVVDRDQQQSEGRSSDAGTGRACVFEGSNSGGDCQGGVGAAWQGHVPDPVLPHRLVAGLSSCASGSREALGPRPPRGARRHRNRRGQQRRPWGGHTAETTRATPRCTTVGVPKARIDLRRWGGVRMLAMSVITTNFRYRSCDAPGRADEGVETLPFRQFGHAGPLSTGSPSSRPMPPTRPRGKGTGTFQGNGDVPLFRGTSPFVARGRSPRPARRPLRAVGGAILDR